MDFEKGVSIEGEGLKIQGSWIPVTPAKPIPTRPQASMDDGQFYQSKRSNWLDDSMGWGFSSEFYQGNLPNSDSTSHPNDHQHRKLDNWESALVGKTTDVHGSYEQVTAASTAGWNNVSYAELLALAGGKQEGTNNAAENRAYLPSSYPQNIGNNQLQSNSIISYQRRNRQPPQMPKYGFPVPYSRSSTYDVNSPPRAIADAVPNGNISFQFAPVTPDKCSKPQLNNQSPPSEPVNIFLDERLNQEKNKSQDGVVGPSTGNNVNKELHCQESCLNLVVNSSSATKAMESNSQQAVDLTSKENHSPKKGEANGIDLNKTPEQKPYRRKKHRPRVVIEGRPKRTPNTVNKQSSMKENQSVKRKYVRKNGIKTSNTPLKNVGAEIPDSNPCVASLKSCKRSLNFNLEGQEGHESHGTTLNYQEELLQSNFNNNSSHLAFNKISESQAQDPCTRNDKSSGTTNLQFTNGLEVMVNNSSAGFAFDLNRSLTQMLNEYILLPEEPVITTPPPTRKELLRENLKALARETRNVRTADECQNSGRRYSEERGHPILQTKRANSNHENAMPSMLHSSIHPVSKGHNNLICSQNLPLADSKQERVAKRAHSHTSDEGHVHSLNLSGTRFNSLQIYDEILRGNESHRDGINTGMLFPQIYKKRRTKKNPNTTTGSKSHIVGTLGGGTHSMKNANTNLSVSQGEKSQHGNANCTENPINWGINSKCEYFSESLPVEHNQPMQNTPAEPLSNNDAPSRATTDKLHSSELLLSIRQFERRTRKRSEGHIRVRDLTTLTSVSQCNNMQAPLRRNCQTAVDRGVIHKFHRAQHCTESPAADKHTKMTMSKYNMGPPTGNMVFFSGANYMRLQKYQAPMYGYLQSSTKLRGSLEVAQQFVSPIDEIIQKLNCLDINGESNTIPAHEQNALVPFREDSRMVPYEGLFDLTRKRRPRPKVELDSETDRVWKLLMGKEASNNVEGTDAEKEKWWEEERRVFRGRADSFIARMHLIQGDRRFTRWNGSVLDSVIGVFLTQNVSDHLSSSAFMSLAARFPFKSTNNNEKCNEEEKRMNAEEPGIAILDSDDTKWNGKISPQSVLHQGSSEETDTLHEAKHMEDRKMSNINISFESNTAGCCSAGIINEESVVYQGIEKCHELPETKAAGIGSASLVEIEDERLPEVQSSEVSPRISEKSPLLQATAGTMANMESGTLLEAENSRVLIDVVPSKNSLNSTHKDEGIRSCSDFNSEKEQTTECKSNGFNCSTSFTELLQMTNTTILQEYYSHGNETLSLDLNSRAYDEQEEARESERRITNLDMINAQRDSFSIYPSSSKLSLPQAGIIPSSNYSLYTAPNSGVLEMGCPESRYSLPSTAEIKGMKDVSNIGRIIDPMKGTLSETTIEQLSLNPQEADTEVTCSSLHKQLVCSFISSGQESCLEKQPHSCNDLQVEKNTTSQLECNPPTEPKTHADTLPQRRKDIMKQANSNLPQFARGSLDVGESTLLLDNGRSTENMIAESNMKEKVYSPEKSHETTSNTLKGNGKEKRNAFDWDWLRKDVYHRCGKRERNQDTMDSLDWEAVRCADVNEIAQAIKERGMNNMLAERIKDFLNRLVKEHESIDLEWLRDVPPDKVKEYLLSVRGLGLKSVECVRLLTLHHLAFPVDTNVGRIAVRLGWVPLQPLPESLQLHLLEMYPMLESIQKYLWPRLCTLDQPTLYELHYQLITFGKVFCTKSKPNCNACPMRAECKHFASAFASARLALPRPEEKGLVSSTVPSMANENPVVGIKPMPLPLPEVNMLSETRTIIDNNEPIIEVPASPEPEYADKPDSDIEDAFYEDPDEIPTIKLNIEDFALNLQNYMQKNNMELQEDDVSKALVALAPEAASIPTPKLKNMSRLRTEHQVYELPDSHPLLKELEKRVPGDVCSYLLAIWTPGETAESIQPPERCCGSQISGNLCSDKTCFSCNSIREANSQTVRGTLLIPSKTAMRGSFPLNGTYFQVNEVFADHDSSLNPIDVPRAWIWNLQRRTVFFGTSIPTIFKGQSTEQIQSCFWRGYVCVRGFDRKTRAPRPLMARLHFPASRLAAQTKAKRKTD